MKTFFGALFITLAIISTIILLPTMLPKTQYPTYTDDELRKIALKEGLYAVPQTDQELLELVDNPNNLMSTQKIVLGKKLFNDKNLSYDRDLSCASCHILKDGGDDNIPTAIGHNKQKNPSHLNSPTVLNSAIATRLFWDGSAKDLEAQAAGPIQAHFEMNMKPQHIVQRVNQNDQYKEMFKQIFGQNAVTFENVKKAIASYERTLLTYGKFDQFIQGDDKAISQKAKNGLTLFLHLGCKGCHSGIAVGGLSMQKFPLRRIWSIDSIFDFQKTPDFPFENKGDFLGKDNRKLFRVPILRNVEHTSPYFHNGSVKDLKEAVRIMGLYQTDVKLNDAQLDEIVEFLNSLSGELVNYKMATH